jgi:NAD(P)-dependent dehydrogenase (short-subunit alcohol dehydrogenase family)
MKSKLTSKMATYLITGTAKGVGLELTKQLSELPGSQVAKIFAITRSPPTPALSDLISRNNGRVVNVLASVDDTKSVEKAAEEIKGQLGSKGLDVLINNAAIQQHSPNNKMEDFSPADFSRILETNLVGPHRMVTAFLPLLRAGTQKKIINM